VRGRFYLWGTLLNTLTVLIGGSVGCLLQALIPETIKSVAQIGIGLVTVGLGLRMFLQTKNVLIVAGAVAFGGVIGVLLMIDIGLKSWALWMQNLFGGGGDFSKGFVQATILFCIGPMTLLGCIEQGLEKKTELLRFKSLLDGISSTFLAAAFGPGVVVSAVAVLVIETLLTVLAIPMKGLAKKEHIMVEVYAAGGIILLAIGINLLGIKVGVPGYEEIPSEVFLPALIIAPLLAALGHRKPAASQEEVK
jgi:uncharacterized membrane protein YqgA involved in biofilm formation